MPLRRMLIAFRPLAVAAAVAGNLSRLAVSLVDGSLVGGPLIAGLLVAGILPAAPLHAETPTPAVTRMPEGQFSTLVSALRTHESFKVRATAAVALGRFGDARAIDALGDALRGDPNYAVRVAAASGLGRLGSVAALGALFDGLHDVDGFVHQECRFALSLFHTTDHIYAFREALSSDDPLVRIEGVRAYGAVMRDNPGLATFVVNALGDDEQGVRDVAKKALSEVPHERFIPLMVDALTNGGGAVRAEAARLVSARADARLVAPLTALMVSVDESDDVRQAAREALAKHAEYVDVPAQLRAAGDVTVEGQPARVAALRLLAVLKDPAAAGLIERALMDPNATTRVAAARAAVDIGDDKSRRLVDAARERETDPRLQRQLELLLKAFRK